MRVAPRCRSCGLDGVHGDVDACLEALRAAVAEQRARLLDTAFAVPRAEWDWRPADIAVWLYERRGEGRRSVLTLSARCPTLQAARRWIVQAGILTRREYRPRYVIARWSLGPPATSANLPYWTKRHAA